MATKHIQIGQIHRLAGAGSECLRNVPQERKAPLYGRDPAPPE